MLAIYKNTESETLKFDVVPNQDASAFFLQVDGSVLSPLLPKLNGTEMALKFVVNGLSLEERIDYLTAAIALLQSSDFAKLRPSFHAAYANEFANSTWKQVDAFCQELNQMISARAENEFEFQDFDLELPADLML